MDEEIKTANPLGYQKISKLLRSLAIPAIIANLVNALYNVVDQIFIGQGIGYLGNAATNIAFPITTICLAIGLTLGIGGASNFNLELGRGKENDKGQLRSTDCWYCSKYSYNNWYYTLYKYQNFFRAFNDFFWSYR